MESLAIIGTGIAGMGCAHYLHPHFDISMYDENPYAGGHTNTVYVKEGPKTIPIDTGFIVFNYRTYPNLTRLFNELDVEVKPANMSFGVQHLPSGLEYSSQKLFAQSINYFRPAFWKLLFQVNRFYKEAKEVLHDDYYKACSLGDYVKEKGYNDDFVHQYIVPMSSALWSTPPDTTLQYPVRTLVNFFTNHGMLGISKQFQWYTVHNGSWQYRDKLIAPFRDRIHLSSPVVKIFRENGKVVLRTANGSEKIFDKVIIATHADQALSLLGDATDLEMELLGVFSYQKNVARLHTDSSVMPRLRSTWSAWNYRVQDTGGKLTSTTVYYMNKLQTLSTEKDYFVSINDPGLIDESKVLRTVHYDHPIFTPKTETAQERLHQLNTDGLVTFCGSYFRYGFHEDAFTSSLSVCTRLLRGLSVSNESLNRNPIEAVTS